MELIKENGGGLKSTSLQQSNVRSSSNYGADDDGPEVGGSDSAEEDDYQGVDDAEGGAQG